MNETGIETSEMEISLLLLWPRQRSADDEVSIASQTQTKIVIV